MYKLYVYKNCQNLLVFLNNICHILLNYNIMIFFIIYLCVIDFTYTVGKRSTIFWYYFFIVSIPRIAVASASYPATNMVTFFGILASNHIHSVLLGATCKILSLSQLAAVSAILLSINSTVSALL